MSKQYKPRGCFNLIFFLVRQRRFVYFMGEMACARSHGDTTYAVDDQSVAIVQHMLVVMWRDGSVLAIGLVFQYFGYDFTPFLGVQVMRVIIKYS